MKLFLDACTIIYLIESQEHLGQKTRFLLTEAFIENAKNLHSYSDCNMANIWFTAYKAG